MVGGSKWSLWGLTPVVPPGLHAGSEENADADAEPHGILEPVESTKVTGCQLR